MVINVGGKIRHRNNNTTRKKDTAKLVKCVGKLFHSVNCNITGKRQKMFFVCIVGLFDISDSYLIVLRANGVKPIVFSKIGTNWGKWRPF